MNINYNPSEHLTHIMLEDLGFNRVNRGDEEWTRIELEALGLIIRAGDIGWHFASRMGGGGFGRCQCLDELITGFEFITKQKLIK